MADAIAQPTNPDEANALMGELRAVESELATAAAAFDREHAELVSRHVKDAAELHTTRAQMVTALGGYAEANRETLVKRGTKTISFAQGTISWRTGKAKVVFDKDDAGKILKFLRRKRWLLLMSEKQPRKLSKTLMLKHRDKAVQIPGVQIVQGETLDIKPNSPQIEAHAEGNPYQIKKED